MESALEPNELLPLQWAVSLAFRHSASNRTRMITGASCLLAKLLIRAIVLLFLAVTSIPAYSDHPIPLSESFSYLTSVPFSPQIRSKFVFQSLFILELGSQSVARI